MLAYILAIAVAIGSFSFYMAAFFVPEMHRRQDFFWSGLGLFYAVVLWFCAGRLTGAVLLGQLTSVALLGGLGWHTLELRRNLTPELVQTPVSWEDLQSLVQRLQLQLQKYIRFDDVTRRLQTAGHQISITVANLRDRAAKSPEAAVSAEVPPLKRSPAYEFEMPTGDGQVVPSEFATVASRQLAEPVSPKTASAETADGARPSAAVPLTADNASDNAQSTAAGPAAADQSDVSDSDVSDQPTDFANEEAAQSLTEPLESLTNQSQQPTPAPSSRSPVTPPSPAQTELLANQSPQPRQPTNPITGAFGRLAAVVQGRRQPKPQRSVIEIPPRPPSISRGTAAAPPAATAESASSPAKKRSAKSPRAVIEIPPRPPSIPRSPAPATASPIADQSDRRQPVANDDANWGDTGEVPPTAKLEPREPIAPPENVAMPDPRPSPPDASWPDIETNWPLRDDDVSRYDTPQKQTDQPAQSTDDTNWPDDEDTNWPD